MTVRYHTVALLLFASLSTCAQTLDPTFGTSGIAIHDAGNSDIIRDIVLQSNGKIVAAGWSYDATNTDLLIARFNSDGSPDNTFGTSGVRIRPTGSAFSGAEAVVVQANSKIVVAGYSNNGITNGFTVWRFNSDGSDDASFAGGSPYFNTVTASGGFINDMVIQPDGRVVVTGPVYVGSEIGACVLRLNTNGTLDTGFSGDGFNVLEGFGINKNYSSTAIALQPDGRILAAGSYHNIAGGTYSNDALCMRYNANGTLDGTFGAGTGVVVVEVPGYEEYVEAIAVQDDGRIMMTGDGQTTGASDWNILLERLNADGTPDATLGTSAILWNPSGNAEYASSLDIQPDGKYLIAGSSAAFSGTEGFMVRCDATNAMGDNSFGTTGYNSADFGDYTYVEAARIQPDGKYVIAGYSASGGLPYDMMLARYDVGISVGIDEAALLPDAMAVFPSPSTASFNVRNRSADPILRLELVDDLGRMIWKEERMIANGSTQRIDVTDRATSGCYLLRAIRANTISQQRIVIE